MIPYYRSASVRLNDSVTVMGMTSPDPLFALSYVERRGLAYDWLVARFADSTDLLSDNDVLDAVDLFTISPTLDEQEADGVDIESVECQALCADRDLLVSELSATFADIEDA